jgi:hypothetical protein
LAVQQDQNQKIPLPKYDQSDPDIAISYYYVDEKRKVWLRAPFTENFVIEEPYHGDDRFSEQNGLLFKIPFLRRVNVSFTNTYSVLMVCLWLKDHQIYTDQFARTGHEFYRCLGKDNNWILIPLYRKRKEEYKKEIKNPILLYHDCEDSFRKTLIIKDVDIYRDLISLFFDSKLVNHFPIVMNGKMKWMVQFTQGPAMLL